MENLDDVFGRAVLVIFFVILMTRVQGLRSFSKMSGFDFAITVAFGSIVGGFALSPSTDPWIGVWAVLSIFLIQITLSFARQRISFVSDILDNEPVLVMRDGEILRPALRKTRMTESDLMAKLREANVLNINQVHAVVMEATGDVSVLHDTSGQPDIDRMIDGVRHID